MGHENCADTCVSATDYYELDHNTLRVNTDCHSSLLDNLCDFNRILDFNHSGDENMSVLKDYDDCDTDFEILKAVNVDVCDVSNGINDVSLSNDDNECEKGMINNNVHGHYSQLENSKNFKLACLNIRSLYPKLEEVISIVKTYDFSIFVVNESWLDESLCDNDIKIPNYDVIRRDRNRQGGGVCIYVKSNLKYYVLNGYGIDIESAWICVTIDSKKVVVGTIYRPPSANKLYDNK